MPPIDLLKATDKSPLPPAAARSDNAPPQGDSAFGGVLASSLADQAPPATPSQPAAVAPRPIDTNSTAGRGAANPAPGSSPESSPPQSNPPADPVTPQSNRTQPTTHESASAKSKDRAHDVSGQSAPDPAAPVPGAPPVQLAALIANASPAQADPSRPSGANGPVSTPRIAAGLDAIAPGLRRSRAANSDTANPPAVNALPAETALTPAKQAAPVDLKQPSPEQQPGQNVGDQSTAVQGAPPAQLAAALSASPVAAPIANPRTATVSPSESSAGAPPAGFLTSLAGSAATAIPATVAIAGNAPNQPAGAAAIVSQPADLIAAAPQLTKATSGTSTPGAPRAASDGTAVPIAAFSGTAAFSGPIAAAATSVSLPLPATKTAPGGAQPIATATSNTATSGTAASNTAASNTAASGTSASNAAASNITASTALPQDPGAGPLPVANPIGPQGAAVVAVDPASAASALAAAPKRVSHSSDETAASTPTSSGVLPGTPLPVPAAHESAGVLHSSVQLTDAERTHLLEHVAQGIGFSNQSGQEIRIHVRPPELGSLQIDVSVKDGALSARIEAQTSAAQQILQDNLPQLKEALAQQGLTVDRIEVRLADPSANGGNRSDVADRSFAQNQQSQRDSSSNQQQQAPEADPDQSGNGPRPVRSARHGHRGLRQLDITV